MAVTFRVSWISWIICRILEWKLSILIPLFVSPSNHKYDIQDYDYIDPHFGKIVDDDGESSYRTVTRTIQHATRYIRQRDR